MSDEEREEKGQGREVRGEGYSPLPSSLPSSLITHHSSLTVLMTADPIGGVWTYALDLAGGLARRGVRVVLATMGGPLRADQWAEAARVPGLEVVEGRWKLEWMEDPWDDLARAGAWLREIERRARP